MDKLMIPLRIGSAVPAAERRYLHEKKDSQNTRARSEVDGNERGGVPLKEERRGGRGEDENSERAIALLGGCAWPAASRSK